MTTSVETTRDSASGIQGRSPRQIAWMRFKRNKVGMTAAGVSITLLSLSLFAPIVCKILGIDPNTLNLDVLNTSGIPDLPNGGISAAHPLGLIPGPGRD